MLNWIRNIWQLNFFLAGKIRADRLHIEAKALMDAGEFKSAFPLMKQSSDAGNKFAPAHVATMLLRGHEGMSPNWSDAVKSLELAQARGEGKVHFILGMIYGMGGYGLKRDQKMAEYHLTQSIEVDSDPAGKQMLVMLKKRQGVFGGKEVPRPTIPWK